MAGEVKSAEKATQVATTFLKQYYYFLRPISAKREDSTWIVRVDVGALKPEIAEIKIDALTSDIKAYSIPD